MAILQDFLIFKPIWASYPKELKDGHYVSFFSKNGYHVNLTATYVGNCFDFVWDGLGQNN